MNGFRNFARSVWIICATLLLFACGGGGGGDDGDKTGTFSLAVTDAPVDGVTNVWVEFTGVTLKPQGGQEISFDFAPQQVDLKALEGENMVTILDTVTVPAGLYNWVQLHVNGEFDGDDMSGTYVVDDMGGYHDLRIPSGSRAGLRLVSGFSVTQNQHANFVIDWDLRKGLTDPIGQPGYFLKPALRITDRNAYGTIFGTVADGLVMGDCDPLIYVYEGADVDPDDMGGSLSEPLTTAEVAQDPNNAGAWSYSVPFLSPMDYTVAFTCDALVDVDPEADEMVEFLASENATVTADMDAQVNF